MVQFTAIFSTLARGISLKSDKKCILNSGKETADTMAKEARKNEMILTKSGFVNGNRSDDVKVSAHTKKGKKGTTNQDRLVIWEEFGFQEDMILCGVFDGHGPWGHLVAKNLKRMMPSLLLCNWQETLAQYSLKPDRDQMESTTDECHSQFEIWKKSFSKTCSTIDYRLSQLPGIDSFYSGSTALTLIKQGDLIFVANVGDSRAVLATTSDDGSLVPIQLTVDLKPNLPEESKRIRELKGRVFSSKDEPGVYRMWMPNGYTLDGPGPGLALSRAFGDYYIKDFGLISDPELTHRRISKKDQFVILATDGVWDVISNQEAVKIVSSTAERAESAKRLVESAACAWKKKRPCFAVDDISAICLFLRDEAHPNPIKAKYEASIG